MDIDGELLTSSFSAGVVETLLVNYETSKKKKAIDFKRTRMEKERTSQRNTGPRKKGGDGPTFALPLFW